MARSTPMTLSTLRSFFSSVQNIDSAWLDLLVRDVVDPHQPLLDVGCGGGRNIQLLLQHKMPVSGIDPNPEAIMMLRHMAHEIGLSSPRERFQVGELPKLPHASEAFETAICCAVLHFLESLDVAKLSLIEMHRVLRPGGVLFVRWASKSHYGGYLEALGNERFRLPGGTEWLLCSTELLEAWTEELGFELIAPIKTVNVHDQRCMTTWVVRKG